MTWHKKEKIWVELNWDCCRAKLTLIVASTWWSRVVIFRLTLSCACCVLSFCMRMRIRISHYCLSSHGVVWRLALTLTMKREWCESLFFSLVQCLCVYSIQECNQKCVECTWPFFVRVSVVFFVCCVLCVCALFFFFFILWLWVVMMSVVNGWLRLCFCPLSRAPCPLSFVLPLLLSSVPCLHTCIAAQWNQCGMSR